MGKKVNTVFMALVFALLAVLLAVEGVEAFCVYNETDVQINAAEGSGGKTAKEFNQWINRGTNACCNWQNKDCNKEGKKDSIVKFNVAVSLSPIVVYICTDFPIKAGGWLTVKGTKDSYECVAHDE